MRILREIFHIKELRKRIGFVFLILFLYKLGTHIMVPGVDSKQLDALSQQGGMLGFANMMSGGALKRFSVFAVGIMPYITASIVIQLLQMDVIPKLAEWNKQGEKGQKKTKKLTRYVSIVLALVQGFGLSFGFNKLYPGLIVDPSIKTYLMITFFLTLGTIVLMVMGELIEKKGIGQGMSVIIAAGIIMGIPDGFYMYYVSDIQNAPSTFISVVKLLLMAILVVALIIGIIYVYRGERRIPIQYSNQNMGNYNSVLPIKVNSAGVIPVIFAVSILMFPVTISQVFKNSVIAQNISKYMNYTSVSGMILYAVMIMLFTYFYAYIQMSPEKIAENLKKSGASIPGIRPGKTTEKYISTVLSRVTFVGAVFLTLLSIVPLIVGNITGLPTQVRIGGTSLIILVGVALDLASRINSHLIDRKYDSFIK